MLLASTVLEGEQLSAVDIKGATITPLIVTALVFSLAYAPSLFWLRKRLGGCRPALVFPLASAIVLNLPVFLLEREPVVGVLSTLPISVSVLMILSILILLNIPSSNSLCASRFCFTFFHISGPISNTRHVRPPMRAYS